MTPTAHSATLCCETSAAARAAQRRYVQHFWICAACQRGWLCFEGRHLEDAANAAYRRLERRTR